MPDDGKAGGVRKKIIFPRSEGIIYEAKISSSARTAAAKPKPFAPVIDIEALVRERLDAPEILFLSSAARESGGALIICDDNTRPTPTGKIIPALSDFLAANGVPVEKQHVLFATGTHRAMNAKEAEKKLGASYGRISWSNHSYNAALLRIGVTAGGIPVDINPVVKEYACVIGVGSVFPHRYCGWSGGGKIILPGVSGATAVAATHWMPYEDPSITLGSNDNLAMREIASASDIAGLSFLIQVICSGDGKVMDIVTGRPAPAHRRAIEIASRHMKVTMPQSDIVIAEAWPEEADLWQAGKALYAAENIVSDGGDIIIIAALTEGFGPHRLYAELMNKSVSEIISYRNGDENSSIAAAAAFVTAQVRKKAKISIVTNSPYSVNITEVTGIRTYKTLQEAVDKVFSLKKTVAVLYQAPLMLPVREETVR